mmetsp:Transcript_20775/g.52764  ORF Transcript_20775/g.52764 Transcript_20775/m.52764 type:complete len:235 (+) Transcript_20775:2750-3454(+)
MTCRPGATRSAHSSLDPPPGSVRTQRCTAAAKPAIALHRRLYAVSRSCLDADSGTAMNSWAALLDSACSAFAICCCTLDCYGLGLKSRPRASASIMPIIMLDPSRVDTPLRYDLCSEVPMDSSTKHTPRMAMTAGCLSAPVSADGSRLLLSRLTRSPQNRSTSAAAPSQCCSRPDAITPCSSATEEAALWGLAGSSDEDWRDACTIFLTMSRSLSPVAMRVCRCASARTSAGRI